MTEIPGVMEAAPGSRLSRQRSSGSGGLRLAVVLALAFGLAGIVKLRFRDAGFDELRWLLVPTARLTEVMTGSKFEQETHRGYLCRERRFEIVPACAGLNFLLIVYLSLMLGHAGRRGPWRVVALRCASYPGIAYSVAITANATRIAMAMSMHDTALRLGPWSPDHLHEIEGVLIFFIALCLAFLVSQRIPEGSRGSTP